jgi:hypothetical protein
LRQLGEAKTSGRLECGTWKRSNGIYYGLERKPFGRRCPISLLLVDKDNDLRLPAEFALIKNDDTRRLHHTFPNVGTQAGRLIHLNMNTYMRNVLIEIFGKVWSDFVDSVDLSEYQDNNSEFHIRDALDNIVERS